MTEPEPRPERSGMSPLVGQYLGAVAMLLVLVPSLLRRAAGDTSTINTLLIVGAVCLLAANVWSVVRLERQQRDRP